MRSRIGKVWGILTLAALFPALGVGAQEAQAPAAGAAKSQAAPQANLPANLRDKDFVPAGSVLHIKLTTTLTTKTNKSGDAFTGQVSQPIVVDAKEVIPKYSWVYGHVAFVKPSKRIKGKAEMRLVIDKLVTPDEDKQYMLTSGLDDTNNAPCAHAKGDNEGTIEGCGKSVKDAAKSAAIAGAMGAGAGATVGIMTRGGCSYYGCWPSSGPGIGTDIMYGAGIGAGTALIYHLLKHEKDIVLVQGSELTFIVNRSTEASNVPPPPPETASQ